MLVHLFALLSLSAADAAAGHLNKIAIHQENRKRAGDDGRRIGALSFSFSSVSYDNPPLLWLTKGIGAGMQG